MQNLKWDTVVALAVLIPPISILLAMAGYVGYLLYFG